MKKGPEFRDQTRRSELSSEGLSDHSTTELLSMLDSQDAAEVSPAILETLQARLIEGGADWDPLTKQRVQQILGEHNIQIP